MNRCIVGSVLLAELIRREDWEGFGAETRFFSRNWQLKLAAAAAAAPRPRRKQSELLRDVPSRGSKANREVFAEKQPERGGVTENSQINKRCPRRSKSLPKFSTR